MTDAPVGGRWRCHPATLGRAVPTGWLVLAPDGDEPVLLSGTAADLWEVLGSPSTLDEIVDALAASYAGDRAEIETDLRAALADLVARGVVLAEGP